MYNGIGLETARGSGTNGFVQRNMAFVRARKEKVTYKTEEEIARCEATLNREPNLAILEHERKRKVELKCMELRELMEEQGFDEEAIDLKVNAFRIKLNEKANAEKPQIAVDEAGRPIVSGTHQIAAASQTRNKRLREAFGISADYVDGTSLNPERRNERNAKPKYALIKDPDDDLPESVITETKDKPSDSGTRPGKDPKKSKKTQSKDTKSYRSPVRRRDGSISERSPEPVDKPEHGMAGSEFALAGKNSTTEKKHQRSVSEGEVSRSPTPDRYRKEPKKSVQQKKEVTVRKRRPSHSPRRPSHSPRQDKWTDSVSHRSPFSPDNRKNHSKAKHRLEKLKSRRHSSSSNSSGTSRSSSPKLSYPKKRHHSSNRRRERDSSDSSRERTSRSRRNRRSRS